MNINPEAARKAVPGFEEAYAVHQLSERNNTRTLSHKFTSDLAQTTSAMKEVTLSGASLATRQAKVVGQTLVSRQKMAKASKKMVIHTGALGVKTGRAVKGMMTEMVDAADKKGKYQPKVKPFIPYDGQTQPHDSGKVHAYEYQQQEQIGVTEPTVAHLQVTSTPAATPPLTSIPARKPVRPLSISLNPSLPNQVSVNLQGGLNPTFAVQPVATPEPAITVSEINQSSAISSNVAAVAGHGQGTFQTPPTITSSEILDGQAGPTASAQVNQGTLPQPSTGPVSPTQQQHSQIPSTLATCSPALINAQPAHPPKLNPGLLQLQASPAIAVQAQGALTIAASISPPTYAQATGVPTTSSSMTRPPRRPLPSSANAPPQRPIAAQRPSGLPAAIRPQVGSQYLTASATNSPITQNTAWAPNQALHPVDQVMYSNQAFSAPTQILTNTPQPVTIEQNQTITQQPSYGQDLLLTQMQMAAAQQTVTNQILLQQQVDMQSMMLAQAQGPLAQQPVYVDQNVYVDQSQYLDVTNVQDDTTTLYADYTSTAEVVAIDDTAYEEAYVTEGMAGEEVFYVEQDSAIGGAYEVGCEADTSETVYETNLEFQDAEVCF